ncbi:MAG: NAD(P)/FAD-dependent oxidoreductase, partial [Acidobacteriota bacterium]
MPEIAVIGAGLTGLVAAYRLSQVGWRVTIFECYAAAGGLVATFEAGGERLECFYHHLFATDTDYLALAAELGLESEIEWLPSRMGILSQGRLWDFGTPASLLRFAPLPWPDKVRFALSVLYLRHHHTHEDLEAVTARDWILRHAGPRVFDAVWGPLLASKFGVRAGEISMAWLWNKVYQRSRTRTASGLGERLGYMRGSFGRLIDTLVERLRERGVALELASPVTGIKPAAGGLEVVTRRGKARVDQALFTAAPPELVKVAAGSLPERDREALQRLESAHALCGVLELDRPLTSFYWLNIADATWPFGGVIEHTNYLPPERYGGRRIVYLSRYLLGSDPLWSMRGDEVWAAFLPFLKRLNPAFEESWVVARHLFRGAHAQPIVPCHYSRLLPPFVTSIPDLYHSCMAQIYPEDRGQNFAVRAGN